MRTMLSRNRLIGLIVALAVFLADQALKGWITGPLRLREVGVIELIPAFRLAYVENFGVSLGMLTARSPEMTFMLIGLTSLIALIVLVWMMREQLLGDILPLALILGGALGNIRDRATLGYVIDYADLHIGEWRPFMVFNLADAAITVGVLLMLARSFLSRDKRATSDAAPAATES